MKLSELVDLKIRTKDYLSRLENFNFMNFLQEFNSWKNLPKTHPAIKDLESGVKSADNLLHSVYTNFLEIIDKEIDNQSATFLTYGFALNGVTQLGPTNSAEEDNEIRKIYTPPELAEQIGSLIRKYTDWRFPTLEIGPGDGFWTDNLVGSDPLYLVDIHEENLKKTIRRYNDKFSRKIRPYLIGRENGKSHTDLSSLPKSQIGFIFSWGVFDYLCSNEIEIYLKECNNILRPGGTMIFSFNNCDTVEGSRYAENGNRSWLTKKILNHILEQNDEMNLVNVVDLKYKGISYAEIKKTGTLSSYKTHQLNPRILQRPGIQKVDIEEEITYNKQQIARIKQLAIQLGIDNEQAIMANQYSPHKLMKLIEVARMKK